MESGILYYLVDRAGYMKFLMDGCRKEDLIIVPNFVIYPRTLMKKIVHFFVVGRFPINPHILSILTGEGRYLWLTTLNKEDRILLQDIQSIRTLRTVAWLCPNVKKYLYISNSLQFMYKPDRIANKIEKIKSMGYQIITFDPQDANIHNLIYAVQFYRFPDFKTTEIKYDFFFCGRKKERGDVIDGLRNELARKGFKSLFVIPEEDQRWMAYEEYLEVLQCCRCVIDITQEGQAGLTRRPVEALFFNKKLITNNLSIIKFDFYRKSNIFVLGIDNIAEINDFMNQEIEIIPDEVKRRYDVNTWIDIFK